MADSSLEIPVEVAYAMPDKQILEVLTVPMGTTALEAVEQSSVLNMFPEIDIKNTQTVSYTHLTLPTKRIV